MHSTPTNLMTTASLPVDRPFFAYQHEWNSGARSRNRVLTKMRQAGADFFFAYEALNDALHTGRNQIFLGCTPASALTVKTYISAFLSEAAAWTHLGKIKSGKAHLELPNGAVIYFIGPKSLAAALHGNVYVSEYAWADSPRNMIALAKSLSMHARYHATYYTTPSPNPEAWQEYKKLIARNSTTCMTFTADDAAASGATLATGAALFDDEWLNDMKKELSAEDWKMLFMCEWPQADKEQAA
ncbi:terminase-like family protein [Citrobacter sp. RHBSTW-00678]|uniref:terminase large subunit domain-containing protein n=2 Tax=Citrobacter TaxID=544 RepID=UPI000DF0EF9E|nr:MULTISPECIES: terminase family protein [Citrobacter freundii complex]EBG1765736.1 terminase-like family protein [Salmonella enterica]MBA8056641.1 terminase-like family protein [Citrobacter sp. RHBSTW-00104]QLV86120.1 terminase-like family protein [Citrobacter sp. RHBSTW-00678]QMA16713.1 terminase-like family protein [Citrobacter sp. RHBSTW-00053]HBC0209492.1 terminase family protein [Salmonella enterica subsp. enterica serovar Napoli]